MITLLVLQGPDKGRRFELPDQPVLVGRDSKLLPLSDSTTSRRHCELRPDGSGWVLKDLGSSNGSYVNGSRVTTTEPIKLGDQIRVGRTLLVFGLQPGVTRVSRDHVALAGEEVGMDSAILNTLPSSEDSLVLAVPEPAAAAVSNLKVLYRLSAALGSSFNVDQVLEVVMDLVFEHVQAEHGVILLTTGDGELDPRVVRTRKLSPPTKKAGSTRLRGADERTDGLPSFKPDPAGSSDCEPPADVPPRVQASRTIVRHVLEKGEGVLSSNAMSDTRFAKGKSVQNLGIRSAMCVPIKARKLDARVDGRPVPAESAAEEVLGVIYIDSSVANYTYSVDQLRLLTAIGLQAGLAVQNAKLYRSGLEAERLAAIGETTAALSHSIKNILQALRGGADVVEMGFRRNQIEQAKKGWGVVDRNLSRIYNLTMNLLAYSRPREPVKEMVNPGVLIRECLELLAPLADAKGVMVLSDVARDQPPIPLDADGIHQALMNLLTNALDAFDTSGDGVGEPDERPRLVRVTCTYDAPRRQSVLRVIDQGGGIPPTVRPHLFELFHSTKGNRGTGLGLAVTRKIVEEHDGTIEVHSELGHGTTFTMTFPAPPDAARDPSGTHGPSR